MLMGFGVLLKFVGLMSPLFISSPDQYSIENPNEGISLRPGRGVGGGGREEDK